MDLEEAPEPARTGAFHPRPSPAALTLALLLVACAVLAGIFGRSIGGRLSFGGGRPLGDVVGDVGQLRTDAIAECLSDLEAPELHPEEARAIVRETLRRPGSFPTLSESGYELRQVRPVRFSRHGVDRMVCATYRGIGDRRNSWLQLFLLPDDGQFLSFDSLGRPRPLVPELTIEDSLPGLMSEREAAVLVWSDGPVLHLACFPDADEAERLREAIGAP
jgi:hypothetical protein